MRVNVWSLASIKPATRHSKMSLPGLYPFEKLFISCNPSATLEEELTKNLIPKKKKHEVLDETLYRL